MRLAFGNDERFQRMMRAAAMMRAFRHIAVETPSGVSFFTLRIALVRTPAALPLAS